METLTLNSTVNYTAGGSWSEGWWQPDSYQPLIKEYYPVYYTYWTTESKIEKAFKLVNKLIEKKLVKEIKTVKDFVELVNSISGII